MDQRNWEIIVQRNGKDIATATTQWRQEKGFDTGWSNFSEKLMLTVTEISEANQGADKAMVCLQSIMYPENGIKSVVAGASEIVKHLDNYVEEWIDVMVRLMDVAGACGIAVLVDPIGEIKGGDLAKVLTGTGNDRSREVINQISEAMEIFRDVDFDEDGDALVGDETRDRLRICFSAILGICIGAVMELGENWRERYKKKMLINENRLPKHGRKR